MSVDAEENEAIIFFRNDFRITGFAEVVAGTLEIGGMDTIDVAIIREHDAVRLVALMERIWPDVRTTEITRLRKLISDFVGQLRWGEVEDTPEWAEMKRIMESDA